MDTTRKITVHTYVDSHVFNVFPETRWRDLRILTGAKYYIQKIAIFQGENQIEFKDEELMTLPTGTELSFQFQNTCSKCKIVFNSQYEARQCQRCFATTSS